MKRLFLSGPVASILDLTEAEISLIPQPIPRVPAQRVVTALAFLERFTQAERIALREAARQNAVLDDWLDMLRAAQEVDLDDERTTAGIAAFVIGGLITAERAAEILS